MSPRPVDERARDRVPRRATWVAASSLAVALLAAPAARAEEPLPTPDRVRAAEEEYDAGRRAFLADQFEAAATHFENAYRDAPRSQVLRNAIRSREKAGQLARAATLADLALRRYPADPQTRELADEVLASAKGKLYELRVRCVPECGLTADGKVVSVGDARLFSVYLQPGPHSLTFGFGEGRGVQRSIQARAGVSDELAVEPPPVVKAPPPASGVGEAPRTGPPETAPRSSGLSPSVFYVGVGLSLAAGAATAISGVATLSSPGKEAVRQGCVGQGTECPLYQSGLAGETRTNIGLGLTGGVVLLTGVVGLFFTDWGRKTPASAARSGLPTLTLGWQSAGLSGRF
ncbi:MAG TPA: tetratricopeptide repeat protein [Polyangiaceae bacterium]|nr:tetratricopeptide repeat protein [Polyangiaceae bacterium]